MIRMLLCNLKKNDEQYVQRRAITATYGTAAGSPRDLQVMRREEPRRKDEKNRNHMTCDERNRDFWT